MTLGTFLDSVGLGSLGMVAYPELLVLDVDATSLVERPRRPWSVW